jgi:hypothetical protein
VRLMLSRFMWTKYWVCFFVSTFFRLTISQFLLLDCATRHKMPFILDKPLDIHATITDDDRIPEENMEEWREGFWKEFVQDAVESRAR